MIRMALLATFGLVLVLAPVLAQDVSGPLDKEYVLVVGDAVKVVVEDHPELEAEYVVPGNGEVSLPPLGKVKLLGRTLTQLETEIAERFKEKGQLTDPKVYLLIMANASRSVYLMGAMSAKIDLLPYRSTTIIQVLAQAGVNQAVIDLTHVKVMRKKPDGSTYIIERNLEDIIVRNESEKDIVVMQDDVIILQSYTSVANTANVYILGKVARPGQYPFTPGREEMTLAKLVAKAGDFTQFADSSEVRILRKEGNRTRAIDIDFSDIIETKIQDFPLKPDDVIYVPESSW